MIEEIDKNQNEGIKPKLENKLEKAIKLKKKIEKGVSKLRKLKSNIENKNSQGKNVETVNYYSITEPDAKLMKKQGTFISGYNAQIMVDSKTNMIISSDVSTNVSDTFTGKSLLQNTEQIIGDVNLRKSNILFDNGYMSKELIFYSKKNNYNLFISTPKPTKLSEQAILNRKKRLPQFIFEESNDKYVCPIGEKIKYKRKHTIMGRVYSIYERICTDCKIADECIKCKTRKRKQISRRNVKEDRINLPQIGRNTEYSWMKNKMSAIEAQEIYKDRVKTVEPVISPIGAGPILIPSRKKARPINTIMIPPVSCHICERPYCKIMT